MQVAASSYRSLIEILVADRLERRRLKSLVRGDKDLKQLEKDEGNSMKATDDKPFVIASGSATGTVKGRLQLDDTVHLLRSPSPERDRISPVGIPAKGLCAFIHSSLIAYL